MNKVFLLARLFWWIIVRRCVDDWRRMLLLVIAVALGVSVFLAVLFASAASIQSFQHTAQLLNAPLEIRSRTGSLSEPDIRRWYPLLHQHLDLQPYAERRGVWGSDGLFSLLGVDVLGSDAIDGLPRGERTDVSEALSTLWIGPDFRYGAEALRTPDAFCPTIDDIPRCLRVRTVPPDSSLARRLGSSTAIIDLSMLRAWEGERFHLSGIAVSLPPESAASVSAGQRSTWEQQVSAAISEVSQGKWLLTGDAERRERADSLLGAFQLNIGVMVLMSLLVCAFTVYNGFQLGVRALLPQVGVLHTLGLPKSAAVTLVIVEGLVLGLCGALVGISLGHPLSVFISELFLSTARTLYHVQDSPLVFGISHVPKLYALAVLIGVLIAILGSVAPALRVHKVTASLSTRSTVLYRELRMRSYVLSALGCGLLGVGAVTLALSYRYAPLAHAAAFFLICIPVVLATPTLLVAGKGIRSACGSHVGTALLAGLAGVLGSARACGVAIATSACGVALLIGLGVMISSFRHTLDAWVQHSIVADVFISSKLGSEPLPQSFYRALTSVEVAKHHSWVELTRFRAVESHVCVSNDHMPNMPATKEPGSEEGREQSARRCLDVPVYGADVSLEAGARVYQILQGEIDLKAMQSGTSVLVSESLARKLQVGPGSLLDLKRVAEDAVVSPEAQRAELRVSISGVYKEFSSERGNVLMAFSPFTDLFGASIPSNVSLRLATGVSFSSAEQQLKTLPESQLVIVQDQDTLRSAVFDAFDRTFAITGALRVIVLIVCALGFAVTLGQLHWDRRRDWKTLQVMGATSGTMAIGVLVEALMLLLPSAILGIPVGLVLALLLVHVINPLSFGWTLLFTPHLWDLSLPLMALLLACIPPILWQMTHVSAEVRTARLSDE